MQKIRWFLLIFAILVALTVTLQNNDAVLVQLLWIDLRMPLSILLACTTAVGFLVGALTTALMLRRRHIATSQTEKKTNESPSETSELS